MTRTATKKSAVARPARLEMTLNRQAKDLIEQAAALSGLSLADYAVSNLVQMALQTIERHERLTLSAQGRDQFLAALDRPSKPLPALEKAGRNYWRATTGL